MNLLTPSTYFCTLIAGEKELYTPDGAISVCYRVQERDHLRQEFVIGEYNEASDRFLRYENRINCLKNIEASEQMECSICHAKYICAGGCPFRNWTVTGDISGIDKWMCFVKKVLTHDAILRIERSVEKGETPIVFGESLFEHLIADNPSLKGD